MKSIFKVDISVTDSTGVTDSTFDIWQYSNNIYDRIILIFFAVYMLSKEVYQTVISVSSYCFLNFRTEGVTDITKNSDKENGEIIQYLRKKCGTRLA